jgi:hypothetical protein
MKPRKFNPQAKNMLGSPSPRKESPTPVKSKPKMKKIVALSLGCLLATAPVLWSATAASAHHDGTIHMDEKGMGAGSGKNPKSKTKKRGAATASASRCQKPTDRDAKGRLCGKRAASEKKGGN